MFTPSSDKILLEKILGEIDLIDAVLEQTDFDVFTSDNVAQHAVVMALLNAGELAKSLSEETREKSDEIPWLQIIGLRNVAAHGYSSLSMEDIWKTINDDVPELKVNIEKIINKFM
jgi:uncharacterized protein with HEPN domain